MTYNPKLGGYQPTSNAVTPSPPPTEHSDSPPTRKPCEPCTCARLELESELLRWVDKLKEAIADKHPDRITVAALHIGRISEELAYDDWC